MLTKRRHSCRAIGLEWHKKNNARRPSLPFCKALTCVSPLRWTTILQMTSPADMRNFFWAELAAELPQSLHFYFYFLCSGVQQEDKDSAFYLDVHWALLGEMSSLFSNSLSLEYRNCHPRQNIAVQKVRIQTPF